MSPAAPPPNQRLSACRGVTAQRPRHAEGLDPIQRARRAPPGARRAPDPARRSAASVPEPPSRARSGRRDGVKGEARPVAAVAARRSRRRSGDGRQAADMTGGACDRTACSMQPGSRPASPPSMPAAGPKPPAHACMRPGRGDGGLPETGTERTPRRRGASGRSDQPASAVAPGGRVILQAHGQVPEPGPGGRQSKSSHAVQASPVAAA